MYNSTARLSFQFTGTSQKGDSFHKNNKLYLEERVFDFNLCFARLEQRQCRLSGGGER